MAGKFVRAAGGVVWRTGEGGGIEVLLVHRARYDDWSLPKGKRGAGEADEETALREVEEETGFVCRLGVELPSTSYVDRRGRPKTVRYWAMEPLHGRFRAGEEVDAVRWVALEGADQTLSYPRDTHVLAALSGALAGLSG